MVKDDDPAFKYKVLLAALSPAKHGQQLLAGKYRGTAITNKMKVSVSSGGYKPKTSMGGRLSQNVGIHYTNINLPMDWAGCNGCRVNNSGAGTSFGYRLSHFRGRLGAELLSRVGGSWERQHSGGANRFPDWAPIQQWGLIRRGRGGGSFPADKALLTEQLVNYQSVTRFAITADGGVVEYYLHGTAFRFDIGTTLVRYLTGQSRSSPAASECAIGGLYRCAR